MKTIRDLIEADVPVKTAYNQWTQFEDFPKFMEVIESVKQVDDTHLHWAAEVDGKRLEWKAEIVEQVPNRKIAWRAIDGEGPSGVVEFEPIGETKTLVKVEIAYDPELVTEQLGSPAGIETLGVKGDLERFKELVEETAY